MAGASLLRASALGAVYVVVCLGVVLFGIPYLWKHLLSAWVSTHLGEFFDPAGMAEASRLMPGLKTATDAYACVQDADAMVILTEWDQFRWLDFARVAAAMVAPRRLVDARNLLDPAAMRRHGFGYEGVGR